MKTRLTLLALLILTGLTPVFSAPALTTNDCQIPPLQEDKLLSLSYYDFDQAESGWRKQAKMNCYHETAVLIDKYLEKHKFTLLDWQMISVTWHAGQMYAFNNEYEIAKIRFTQSIDPNELENPLIRWNDYVYATIAFLNNDADKLNYYREQIANGPILNGKKPNLDVVDSLIRYIDKPYSIAYPVNQ